ncbi:hypothetical protein TYRP_023237 [Tyrophagus putrescentiae]|nr:hypothetical protein TYRP_023237 [Tyrophagus putrescentiae]
MSSKEELPKKGDQLPSSSADAHKRRRPTIEEEEEEYETAKCRHPNQSNPSQSKVTAQTNNNNNNNNNNSGNWKALAFSSSSSSVEEEEEDDDDEGGGGGGGEEEGKEWQQQQHRRSQLPLERSPPPREVPPLNVDVLVPILRRLITALSASENARLWAEPTTPLNALVSLALVSQREEGWQEAVRLALRYQQPRHQPRPRQTLKLLTGPYCLPAYRQLLDRHRLVEGGRVGVDARFELAADLNEEGRPAALNDPENQPQAENHLGREMHREPPLRAEEGGDLLPFDPTWLQHTDHLIVSQLRDVGVWRLAATLRHLFTGLHVRHLVLGNVDLNPVTLLSAFPGLQSLTLFELPDCRHRQRALFSWLANGDPEGGGGGGRRYHPPLPPRHLEELHIFEEKEGVFAPMGVEAIRPLLRRLTHISLVGYPPGRNLLEVLLALDPQQIRSIFPGPVRLAQQLLKRQYGLQWREDAAGRR